ncbi:MAG: hypothetical protein MJY67_07470 [Bacteroidales bacterium]|nr:hypothetical protein [Bacteroidales bacterium]
MYKTAKEGQRYGRLVVLGMDEVEIGVTMSSYYRYICKCDCGNVVSVPQSSLMGGRARSCGCYRQERAKAFLDENRAEFLRRRRERLAATRAKGWKMLKEKEFTKGSLLRFNGELCTIKSIGQDTIILWSHDKKRHYYKSALHFHEFEAIPVTWGGLYENGFREDGDNMVRRYDNGIATYNVYTHQLDVEGPHAVTKTKVVDYLHQVQEALAYCGLKEEAKEIKA